MEIMKNRKRLMVFLLFVWIASITGTLAAQGNKLVSEDQFIKELSKPLVGSQKSKLRFRSVSVQEKKPPEVTVQFLFEFGSNQLTDAFSKNQLQEAGKALSSEDLSEYRFKIEGHTDNIGSRQFNLKLSKERANAIKSFLCENYGIDKEKLVAIGRGESMPIASNDTEEGRALNRRVVFIRMN